MRVARATLTRAPIAEAMASGELSLKHAELIVNFLPRLDQDKRDQAARELVKAARAVDPTTLYHGLRDLRDRLCLDETAEQRAVRQHEGRWLRWVETFDGMVRLEAMFPPNQAAVIQTALAPLSEPAGELDERHIGQRRADAMVELAHIAMDRGELPDTAGEPTQMLVVTDLDDLIRRLRPGDSARSTLDGIPITPNTVRMHACDAGIIPAVMRGKSEVNRRSRSVCADLAAARYGQPCTNPKRRLRSDF